MSIIKRKKASRKNLILQKAAAMFREKGYAATSMRDLADTVGIEAASLYNHIKSKSEMLQEIIFRIATDAYVHLEDMEDEGLTTLQRIESIMRFHLDPPSGGSGGRVTERDDLSRRGDWTRFRIP